MRCGMWKNGNNEGVSSYELQYICGWLSENSGEMGEIREECLIVERN